MPHQYVWRKQASDAWLHAREADLLTRFKRRVAFIERPGRKRVTVETYCATRREAAWLAKEFGGSLRRSPRTISRARSKQIKIGGRLVVTDRRVRSAFAGRPQLVIPAAGAFGTGEHTTTAMCLRLIEKATRRWPDSWRMLDAGTGSGILALAARRFGARDVIAIDNDPRAIAIARNNARLNRVRGIRFEITDAKKPITVGKVDLIAANLFSDLLIAAIPHWHSHLKPQGKLILSGILRSQERGVIRALRREAISVEEIRRREKWVAIMATNSRTRLRRVRQPTHRIRI
jgi:ribosomal protein L11 methyltransferase